MNSDIMKAILAFRDKREWAKFHTLENLSKSISIEAAELLEHFQWGDAINPEGLEDELADILIYCFLFANRLGVDPIDIMGKKLERNERRFPVDRVKGNSGKSTRVDDED